MKWIVLASRNANCPQKDWKDLEYFHDSWRNRIGVMARFVPEDSVVLDLGCGRMWLKEILPMRHYLHVDYKQRDEETLVCDFSKNEFPEVQADVAFVSGCLEYVRDHQWFISQISSRVDLCVISYCSTDEVPDLRRRRANAWVNDLSREEVISFFRSAGMELVHEARFEPNNNIFVFRKVRAVSETGGEQGAREER